MMRIILIQPPSTSGDMMLHEIQREASWSAVAEPAEAGGDTAFAGELCVQVSTVEMGSFRSLVRMICTELPRLILPHESGVAPEACHRTPGRFARVAPFSFLSANPS
jgi:hypothetical protein